MTTRTNWRGDLAGGLDTAVIGIPLSVGLGMYAFAPLGEGHTAIGVMAGLYAFIIAPLIVYALGARGSVIYGPRNMSTFVVHAMLAQLVGVQFFLLPGGAHDAVVLVAAVLTLAALIQFGLAAASLGTLAKYIPHPVIAGFQNGAALLLLIAQIDPLLGAGAASSVIDDALPGTSIQPLTVLVAVVTVLVTLGAPRVTRRIPPIVVGVAAGTLLYFAIWAVTGGKGLGPIVGPWEVKLADTFLLRRIPELFVTEHPGQLIAFIVAWAITLALVASLDVLLCLKVIDNFDRGRADGNAALRNLGIGNAVSAGFGALFANVSLVNSISSFQAGGRTRFAGLLAVGLMVLTGWFAPILIALLPRVVIAALLAVTALRLFDRWTLYLLRSVFSGDAGLRRSYLLDLLIIVMVVALTLVHQLVAAVALGVALSIASFIVRMSRSIVRRSYRGDVVHSRKTRDSRDTGILAERGAAIMVYELEGALFFGTADKLAQEIERIVEDRVRYVILDVRRLHDMDTTAAHVLMQLRDTAADRGCIMVLGGFAHRQQLTAFVRDSGMAAAFGREHLFQDADDAMEWCEDRLIAGARDGAADSGELSLGAFDLLRGLSTQELTVLAGYMRREAFRRGDAIMREGEDGDEMFLVASGSASVRLAQGGVGRATRLVTFAPGTIVGELALLDRDPRSATVEADNDMVCYGLTESAFERLRVEHPEIALRVLSNLSIEMSRRLRRANRIIYQLEH